jgi:hypothetical protein
VFIYVLRSDLEKKWGMPSNKPVPEAPFVPLEDFLIPASHPKVVQEFKDFEKLMREMGLQGTFRPTPPDEPPNQRVPRCSWTCGAGGFGERAFTRSIPALKAGGVGP